MILSQFIQAPLVAFGICAPLLISSVEVLGISRSKVIFPLGIVAVRFPLEQGQLSRQS